jgi:NAD-dependent deacetylase
LIDSLPAGLLQIIEKTSYICVLTGAGISAESGIATFRGQDGLWAKYNPQDLASEPAFRANPELVWAWYQHRRRSVAAAMPNPGHAALSRIEHRIPQFTLATQNVDGLHRVAGSQNVLELHGNIMINRCFQCGIESAVNPDVLADTLLKCPCGGLLRPGVVWFGEPLPADIVQKAVEAARHCQLFLSVGTSSLVYPAASLPEIALEAGIPVVEINPEVTAFSERATFSIHGRAGEILPILTDTFDRVYASSSRSAD